MKQYILFFSILIVFQMQLGAQVLDTIWSRSYGGTNNEYPYLLAPTSDSGIIVAGNTASDDGYVSGHHGLTDFWVARIDKFGDTLWTKTLGGSGSETATAIRQTSSGGFVIAGYTNSTDGDVDANNGGYDYWVVNLSQAGSVIWSKNYGGSADDKAYDIQVLSDTSFVLVGNTKSNDGDVLYNHGTNTNDIWVLKLDGNGDTLWTKSYGGSGEEYGFSIGKTSFSTYIIGGSANSTDGDVNGVNGSSDFWIIHANTDGDIIWTKTYGGTNSEAIQTIKQTADRGYLAVGYTLSDDGDVTGHQGMQDFWILKLNTLGDTTWTKTFGGSELDIAYAGIELIDTTNSNTNNYYRFNTDDDYAEITHKPLLGILEEMFVLVNANPIDLSSNQQTLFKMGGDGGRGGMNVQFRKNNKIRVIHNNGSPDKTWSTFSLNVNEDEENIWGFSNKLNEKVCLYKNGAKIDEDIYDNYDSTCYELGVEVDCNDPDVDSVFYGTLGTALIGYIATKNTTENFFNGAVSSFLIFNVVPDSAEIALISRDHDSIPFKYMNASKDSIVDGTLLVGQQYLIIDNLGGADFTPAGAPNNDKGTVFIASDSDVTWGNGALYAQGVVTYLGKDKYATSWTDYVGIHDCNIIGNTSLVTTYDELDYYVAGIANSSDGDVFDNKGASDAWLVKLTGNGDTLLTKTFGGSGSEGARSLGLNLENNLVFSGSSSSNDYDVHGNNGGTDFWVTMLDEHPTCQQPTELLVSEITMFSAVFEWTENSSAAQWEIMIGESGFDTTGVTPLATTNNPYTYIGLNQGISYDWYVRSICSEIDNSEWSGPEIFTTLLPAAPDTIWSNTYGGSEEDIAYHILETTNSSYLVAGYSESEDGDVPENKGLKDYWILNIGEDGNTLWSKNFGGTSDDRAYDIIQTLDGGYFITGSAKSVNGDVHGNHGSYDYWGLKLDENLDTAWTKCYGGQYFERSYEVAQTIDSGYIFAGYTVDNSFPDTSLHRESRDYWILKTDKVGDSVWSKIMGGNSYEIARSVAETYDSGYIVAGYAKSRNYDVHGNHGSYDMWVVRFNYDGDTLWTRCYGGSSRDEAYSIQQTLDSGYIIAGTASSTNYEVHDNKGGFDFWVVKTDENGDTLWTRSYGGTGDERAFDIRQTADTGYLVAGYTESTDGDVTGNKGLSDYWILKLNQYGDSVWTKTMGGSGEDSAFSIYQKPDGKIIVAGSSNSTDGDVFGNHGGSDYWVVKIEAPEQPPAFQNIDLNAGWNIFSLYATPDSLNMLKILDDLIDSGFLVKVIDEAGGFIQYIPGLGWLNTIGDVSLTEGYYIKVNEECHLKSIGTLATTPFTIPLNTGWNIMGYPLTASQDALDAFQDLRANEQLIKVIDEAGGFVQYIPGLGWLNTINDLQADEGYYIKVNSDVDLSLDYPTPMSVMAPLSSNTKPVANSTLKPNPFMPMNIIVTGIDDLGITEGAEINVYDGELLVGIGTLRMTNTGLSAFVVASMDDPTTKIVDGFIAGNELSFKYFNKGHANQSVELEFNILFGEGIFTPLETVVVAIDHSITNISNIKSKTFNLTCFPNPVSKKLNISYQVTPGVMEIEIYNIHGNLIGKVYSGYNEKGPGHLIYLTDQLSKGMYLIKLNGITDGNPYTLFTKFLKL